MAAPARSVENLGRNLRALIQQLVVETRKPNFNRESPATQTLLKNFASQAHTYQIAAKNAGKKLNANQARANLKGNAAAAANAAAAKAAANVSAAAGSAAEAAKANATPSALRTRLVAMKNKATAALRNLRAPKPVATLAPTAERVNLAHTTFNSGKKYFNTQPNSNRVAANKLRAGAKKRILGGWNYGVNNSRKATFWKEYNALDKSLENMARTRNFTRYIPLGRNANKNIKKYPKYTQFFTNVKNLPGLNTRRNALLTQEVGPLQVNAFGQSIDDLLKQYNKYKGYNNVESSIGNLARRQGGIKGAYMSSANRTVFKGFANKGPEEYRNAKRNVVRNRKAYGTDPEFKKFWANYNKSEAATKLGAAMSNAIAAANKASAINISVANATRYAENAARAAREARTYFNKTNRSSSVYKSHLGTANAASKRAQASLAAAKKREAEAAAKAAAKAAANAKAAAATKAAANKAAAEAVKAAANKTAKITKLKKNISNARNAAFRALQAVNASKAEAEAAKAQTLRAQLNNLGTDQAAKKVANTQVQEARGHANAAKKAAANRTFKSELAQFNKVKSYAKPESLAAILKRMEAAAPIAGIAATNSRLTEAREDQHKVAIKFFIQEVWPKTARGGAPGNANVNRIARSYGLTYPLSPEDKNIMRSLIPNNANKNSIIGWKRLERRADGNYTSRRDALRQVLFGPPVAAAPPAPPPPTGPLPGSRGAALLEPNKRGRPGAWTINTAFTNAYAKNNQDTSNLYIKRNNGTYRKVNNSSGKFTNANVYNWNAAVKNFAKR